MKLNFLRNRSAVHASLVSGSGFTVNIDVKMTIGYNDRFGWSTDSRLTLTYKYVTIVLVCGLRGCKNRVHSVS